MGLRGEADYACIVMHALRANTPYALPENVQLYSLTRQINTYYIHIHIQYAPLCWIKKRKKETGKRKRKNAATVYKRREVESCSHR